MATPPQQPTFEMRIASIRADLVDAHTRLENALATADRGWDNVGPTQNWNVRELLAHLASAEAGHLVTVRRIASGKGGVPQDFDADRWNATQQRRTADLDVAVLMERLDGSHREMLTALAAITPAELQQRAHLASGADGTLEDELGLVAVHKREHTRQVEDALNNPATT